MVFYRNGARLSSICRFSARRSRAARASSDGGDIKQMWRVASAPARALLGRGAPIKARPPCGICRTAVLLCGMCRNKVYINSLAEQSAARDDRAYFGREGGNGVFLALGEVFYGAARKVHFHFVAVLRFRCGGGAFENGQTDIYAVTEEYAREVAGYDAGDAARLNGDGGVLAGGAAAEVLFGDYEVTRFDLADEVAGIISSVLTLSLYLCTKPFILSPYQSTPILPRTAEHAATYGEARYISLSAAPILPTKLRLVVATHFSLLASMPM